MAFHWLVSLGQKALDSYFEERTRKQNIFLTTGLFETGTTNAPTSKNANKKFNLLKR